MSHRRWPLVAHVLLSELILSYPTKEHYDFLDLLPLSNQVMTAPEKHPVGCRLLYSPKRLSVLGAAVLAGMVIYYMFYYSAHRKAVFTNETEGHHFSSTRTRLLNDAGHTSLSYTTEHLAEGNDVRLTRHFPRAIIIGVRKGGTRALIDMLKTHPAIEAARGEVHYFDHDDNFKKGLEWYIERMPYIAHGQISIEKSPSYFVNNETPHRIYTASQNIKLLLIVRDPIERAISDFSQLDAKKIKRDGTRYTFGELVFRPNEEVNTDYSPISISMYDVHMDNWLKYFRLEQFHIVNGDELIRDPVPELQRVETFLGVSPFFRKEMFYFNATKGFYCWKKSGRSGVEMSYCLGGGKGREHPVIPEEVISRLRAFFRPHNDRFYQLVGLQFGW